MTDEKGRHVTLLDGDVMWCRNCGKLVWPTVTMIPVAEETSDPLRPKLETIFSCHFCGKKSTDINEVVKYYKNRRQANEFNQHNGERYKGTGGKKGE